VIYETADGSAGHEELLEELGLSMVADLSYNEDAQSSFSRSDGQPVAAFRGDLCRLVLPAWEARREELIATIRTLHRRRLKNWGIDI
jgi:hypothetical protein